MSCISEFIHLAFEISGLAFNPVQGSLIIDMEMKHLCYFDQKSLHDAAVSHAPLHPVNDGSARNCIIDNSGDYMQWNYDPVHSQIIAVKAGSAVEFFDISGKSSCSLKIEGKYPVYNVFPSADNKHFLCLHSKPVNPDFEETGAAVFDKSAGTYRISSLIRSQELAVNAVWNANVNSWIIHDIYRKKLYSWKADAPDAVQLNIPQGADSIPLDFLLDNSGLFLTAYYYNENKGSYVFWTGDISGTLIKWRTPYSVRLAECENVSIDMSGTRIAFLEADSSSHSLHIVNVSDTEEICTLSVPEKCTGLGIGWISKSVIACAGSDWIMMTDIDRKVPLPKNALPKLR